MNVFEVVSTALPRFVIIARAVILNLVDCFVDGCVDCRQVLFCADC